MAFISNIELQKIQQKMVSEPSELKAIFRGRSKNYHEQSVTHNLVEKYKNEGWQTHDVLKTKTKLRKNKTIAELLEDEIWCQMYSLGFDELNFDETLELPFGKETHEKKQIDVLAIKDDIALVIECKSSEKQKKYQAKDEFELLSLRLDGFRKAIIQYCGRPMRVKYVLATRNLRVDLESIDMKRFVKTNSYLHNDGSYRYVKSLISKYKSAAGYQFLGLLFKNEIINDKKIEIPALEGQMGGLTYYMFSIEPGTLLKMSFVLHRTKANEEEMPTYQRLLVPSRLSKLTKYIDGEDGEGGGFFPNSLILNFNTKEHKLRFEPGKSFKNTGSKFGTLILPNAYRIAYVIDGQHRLYGYANSKFKDTSTVPVVAFKDLNSIMQLKMFVDINENQKAVSKTLRETLKKDLYWGHKFAKERMDALVSAITIKLSEDSKSPLYDAIEVGEDEATIKMASFTDGLRWSGLIPTAKGNVYDKNQNQKALMYDINNQTHDVEMKKCLNRVFKFICLIYDFIEKDYYNLFSEKGGLIMSDRGVLGLITLVGHLNALFVEKGDLNLDSSPEERFSAIQKHLIALLNGLNEATDKERAEVFSAKGSDRVRTWRIFFMTKINSVIKDFEPLDLVEWREKMDDNIQDKGRKLGIEIEKIMKTIVLHNIKILFSNWELEINPIKRSCLERKEKEQEQQYKEFGKGDPNYVADDEHWTTYMNVMDYKSIIIGNWSKKSDNSKGFIHFEELFSLDIGLGEFNSKAEKTKWIAKLNSFRNLWAHEGTKTKRLTKNEVDLIELMHTHCKNLNYPKTK